MTKLSRRDVGYTVVSRFEEAFRLFLSDRLSVFFAHYFDGIPTGIIEKARNRTAKASWEDTVDFLDDTDFPDLKEIACYNDMYKKYFPDTDIKVSEFQSVMEDLYFLRCKIAHVKQYFNALDLDRLIEHCKRIIVMLGGYGDRFNAFLKDLEQEPERIVIPTPIDFLSEDYSNTSIPNNLPTPDYEYEGGFIGRDEDIKKITNLIEGNLHRVVTISGAGGVGKTALALRIVQKLMQKPQKKFDGVVWLSAKENRLSYVGIEDIEPTVKSYEELLDTIFEVMGFGNPSDSLEKKEADVETVFNLHERILIIIDNLETISDERIKDFILDAHPKVKILITSRRGLGQVERRHGYLRGHIVGQTDKELVLIEGTWRLRKYHIP
ncbi:MAG: NB-ARC domain-containing protein, partial [Nitrososphaera sp.]